MGYCRVYLMKVICLLWWGQMYANQCHLEIRALSLSPKKYFKHWERGFKMVQKIRWWVYHRGHHGLLSFVHGHTVTGSFFTIELQIQKVTTGNVRLAARPALQKNSDPSLKGGKIATFLCYHEPWSSYQLPMTSDFAISKPLFATKIHFLGCFVVIWLHISCK